MACKHDLKQDKYFRIFISSNLVPFIFRYVDTTLYLLSLIFKSCINIYDFHVSFEEIQLSHHQCLSHFN